MEWDNCIIQCYFIILLFIIFYYSSCKWFRAVLNKYVCMYSVSQKKVPPPSKTRCHTGKNDTFYTHKYSDKWTKIGVDTGICLGNNHSNFQLHRFTRKENTAKSFRGGYFFDSHCMYVNWNVNMTPTGISHYRQQQWIASNQYQLHKMI